ncbi:MAG: hypothetical protein GF388_08290 [Candidatus Aegiribacteria sp.]|nr:hypothetical protein [Candidatus Aegiribacteria sp.]MBD3295084.1 hypothetical protein [Candidatus Fermentibacteria bacterium]
MKFAFNVSAFSLFLIACSGSDSIGPSQPAEIHGWIVGEAPSSGLTILQTSDGTDWTSQGDSLDFDGTSLLSVVAIDSLNAWVAGGLDDGWGVVIRTTDGGITWERMGTQSQIPNATMCIAALSQDIACVTGVDNSILKTSDGGATWVDISDPAFEGNYFQGIHMEDAFRIWACGGTELNGKIIHTQDGGASWSSQADSLIQGYPIITITGWDGNNLWAVGHGYTILRTTDGGDNWNLAVPDSVQVQNNDANGIALTSADEAWVALDFGNIWRTTNGGNEWEKIDLPSELQGFYYLRVCALDGNTVWITGRSPYGAPEGIVIHTEDGGTNWSRLDDGSFEGLWGISLVGDKPN